MLNRVSKRIQDTICSWCVNILEVSPESRFYGWVRYGAGMLFINLVNTITLILLICWIGLPAKNVFVFAVAYSVLRITSFGVHADSIALYLHHHCLFVFSLCTRRNEKRPLDNNRFLFRFFPAKTRRCLKMQRLKFI